jgi:hypothetical protein
MVTEVIEDKKLLQVLQNAIEFEETKGKQKSCYHCGEEFQIQTDTEPAKTGEIPDQWTCSKGHNVASIGWEWHDVTDNYHLVQRLLRLGLAKINLKTNKHTHYHLADRSHANVIIRESNQSKARPAPVNKTQSLPDLFSNIVGHDQIKRLVGRTILSEKPVHLLLVGPPASAKTMFQLELESMMPDAYFVDGSNLTAAGLVELLFENDIRFLLIDEIEEIDRADLGILASFMQTGRLTETKYGRTRTKEMNISIIGSCNDTSRFSKKLLSRFLCVYFTEYSYNEFIQICRSILVQRGTEPLLAEKIADLVWNQIKSRDIRDAIKISCLVKNEDDLKWILEMLQKGILVSHHNTI